MIVVVLTCVKLNSYYACKRGFSLTETKVCAGAAYVATESFKGVPGTNLVSDCGNKAYRCESRQPGSPPYRSFRCSGRGTREQASTGALWERRQH
ncbi:hypothetical protein ACMGDM_15350 [Sphingomonas sp. DT-51]|uniref:NADH-quinone oxidoreductase subunit D-related protein n=1 Tax=Sphingomonas sp. DT-51 TaxID=3396165 RepID=UPI003F1AA2F5